MNFPPVAVILFGITKYNGQNGNSIEHLVGVWFKYYPRSFDISGAGDSFIYLHKSLRHKRIGNQNKNICGCVIEFIVWFKNCIFTMAISFGEMYLLMLHFGAY